MMRSALVLSLLCAAACGGDDGVASSEDNLREVVDYRVWSEPEPLELDEATPGEVAYGRDCENVEPTDPDVDVQISCGSKWAEVAWYELEEEALAPLLESGATTLTVSIALPEDVVERRARMSIHRVAADEKQKLASDVVFDGDALQATIEPGPFDYYVYIAQDSNLFPILNSLGGGTLSYEVTAQLD
jgi:hypothetical protein